MVSIEETKQLSGNTTIDVLAGAPRGTHSCLFYQTRNDLIDILVPYFKDGLESNEFCIWAATRFLDEKEITKAMRKAVPDFDKYSKRGQIEVHPNDQYCLDDSISGPHGVLRDIAGLIKSIQPWPYDGIRLAGNGSWFEGRDREALDEYEEQIDKITGKHRLTIIHSYWLDICGASEIMHVVGNHESALVKCEGNWQIIENAECKRAKEKLLECRECLRSKASELSLTEERERRRIATDLHDCISQDLGFSKLKLDTLRISASSDVLAGPLGEISDLLEKVIEGTRSLTFDLRSPTLFRFGFEQAVEEYLMQQVQERHGIKSAFADDGLQKPLDYDVCAFLYRAVCELLINVVKHAQAHSVKVSICRRDGEIEIVVEDDGVGLDLSEISPVMCGSGGLGLSNIRERLYYLSGHPKITSEPGDGTLVTLTAPLKTEKGATIESQNECYNYSGR